MPASYPWADLVFHVLAHARGGQHLAPSLFEPAYVAQVEALLGPASGRLLGEDLRALDALPCSFARMVNLQHLAWLFAGCTRAEAAGQRSLAELLPGDVDRPDLLPLVRTPEGELLFCAALLELPSFERLPPAEHDPAALEAATLALAPVAPWLRRCRFAWLRALGRRGRVVHGREGGEIWSGVPGWGGATLDHVTWQAAHEATVLEVSERCADHAASHDAREEIAVALLARRARAAGLAGPHGRWCSYYSPPHAVLGDALDPLLQALDAAG